MVISARKWVERLKFVFLFLLFTYVVSQMMQAADDWIKPLDRYGQPSGHAVKVLSDINLEERQASILDRLRFFYWFGQ